MDDTLVDSKQKLMNAYLAMNQEDDLFAIGYLKGLQDAALILEWEDVLEKMEHAKLEYLKQIQSRGDES